MKQALPDVGGGSLSITLVVASLLPPNLGAASATICREATPTHTNREEGIMPDYDPTVSTPRASDDSGTAPRQGRTITLPDFAGIKRITGQVSWTRLVIVLLLILLWSIASYQGWVIMPNPGAVGGLFGGLLLLVIPLGLVLAVLVDNKIVRLLCAVGAFIAGLIFASQFGSITGLFDDLTLGASLLTVVGLLVTLVVLVWVCRKPAQSRPRQTAPRN